MKDLTVENIVTQKRSIKNKLLYYGGIFKIKNWLFLYYYVQGLRLMGKHKYNEAIKQFEKCLFFGKDNIYNLGSTYMMLGCSYFDIGINDKAKYYLLKGLEIDPQIKDDMLFGSGPEVTSRLGVIYAQEGEYKKAKEYLENALRCKPKIFKARSYTNWGMVDKYLEEVNRQDQNSDGEIGGEIGEK
jgi:tetratricopeptide (TPR) repeat protein